MLEQDKIIFTDTASLSETPGIRHRATESYLRSALQKRFPGENFARIHVQENTTGRYQHPVKWLEKIFGGGVPVSGLPDYIEVEILHKTGDFAEMLIVWSPVAWNDRFAGTAGGGTGIGGRGYLTRPKKTQRGWTVPFAIMNGFSAATMYAGNVEGFHDYIMNNRTGTFSQELYENWRLRSTHNMTVFGKAVTEILHDRPVKYSYMNGGSGGGRQSLMEVQNYPEDYDGVWASCPAIHWNHFLLGGFWAKAVMQDRHHFIGPGKTRFFMEQVWNSVGGRNAYFHKQTPTPFDARTCIGMKSPNGILTIEDAEVMNEIWNGPHRTNGEFLWYGFYPGVKNWQNIIPVATYYYPLFSCHEVREAILSRYHARWITGNPKQNFRQMSIADLEALYDESQCKF